MGVDDEFIKHAARVVDAASARHRFVREAIFDRDDDVRLSGRVCGA
jgi:hypothetical protein